MEGATPRQKIFVFVVGVISSIALLAGIVFLLHGESLFACALLLLGIAVPISTYMRIFRDELGAVSSWQCFVPKLPIDPSALDDMSQLLEHIRVGAFNFLHDLNNDLRDKHVRANAFLADYRRGGNGIAFKLVMLDKLRKNMNHPPEWQLEFGPGQGATGCVFIEADHRVTRRLPTDEGEWDAVFKMSDELKEKVHKDLKWIVSLPLKDPVSQCALAVLNVDGLDYDFSDEQYMDMVTSVSRDCGGLAALMAKQERVKLFVRVEEIQK